jgi:hypothetical protein
MPAGRPASASAQQAQLSAKQAYFNASHSAAMARIPLK